MLACVFSLFSLFDFKMSLFSNDRKKTWTTIKVKRQWWMEIDSYHVSFRHSKKKEPFLFFWLTATCNCWTLFWLFHSIRCWLVLLVPWKTIYKNNASVCSFNVIWNNFLKLPCRCMINAGIGVGKITCHLLLFLPFQFIQQMRAFSKLRESSFLSVAQLCYWYHENREWRHFILQKKKITFSTTNKSRFFI